MNPLPSHPIVVEAAKPNATGSHALSMSLESLGARALLMGFLGMIVAFALVQDSGAADDDDRSPFLPSGHGASAPAPQTNSPIDRLEFRGVITLPDATYVNFFDSSVSRSVMLAIDQTNDGMKASDLRVEESGISVLIESGGQSRRLSLKEAKIIAAATPTPVPVPAPVIVQAQGQPGVNPAVATGPISDEEARQRMQRVAEEIRRRREMRRDMLDRAQQPGQAQGVPAPPPPNLPNQPQR